MTLWCNINGWSVCCENSIEPFSLWPSVAISFFLLQQGESVFARCLSSLQAERVSASSQLKGPSITKYTGDKKEFIEHIRKVRGSFYKSLSTMLVKRDLFKHTTAKRNNKKWHFRVIITPLSRKLCNRSFKLQHFDLKRSWHKN